MKLKKRTKKLLLLIIACPMIVLGYSSLETYWIKDTYITIASEEIPKSFDGKRVIFLSDVHHGKYFPLSSLRKLITRINDLHPDIVLLGGDYSYEDSKYIESFFNEFQKVKSKYGKFGIIGNHDNFVDGTLTKAMMRKTNVYLCDNLSFWLNINGERIKIGGVGDLQNEKQFLGNTISDVKDSDFCILMCHQPSYVEHLNTDKIDLTLSGHTHGGQVTMFGFWAPILPTPNGLFSWPNSIDQKFSYGLVYNEGRLSYTTSGIGTRFPHFRFFARPEIVVFTLKRIAQP